MTESTSNSEDESTSSNEDESTSNSDEEWFTDPMWTQLGHLPFVPHHQTAFKSHNNSFIVIPVNLSTFKTIYRYCAVTNTWSKMFDLNFFDAEFIDSIAIDEKTNSIFVSIIEAENKLYQVNLDTKTSIAKPLINIDQLNEYVKMIATNNKIHFIGSDTHFCWNKTNDILNKLELCPLDWCEYAIYNKSNYSILSICSKAGGAMWEPHDIYEFLLSTNKWVKWNIKIPNEFKVRRSVIIMSANNEYIISLGGTEFEQGNEDIEYWTDIIFVINTRHKYIRQSEICGPDSRTTYNGVLVNDAKRDELLVFGWIKRCYDENEFENMQILPNYIVKFIRNWISIEMIHLIGLGEHGSKPAHWIIDIDDIICSVE